MKIPLAVTGGIDQRGMKVLRKFLRKAHIPARAYRAATADPDAQAQPMEPGSSFAAMLSYGDLGLGGVGTTTARCGNLALAWGHPFFWTGDAQFGMSPAEVLGVIPNDVLPGFKFASVLPMQGTVDQDRLTGIRGIEGELPPTVPVLTDIVGPDTGQEREGETDVVPQEFLPIVAALHLLANLDVVNDRIGEGTVSLSWRIEGSDAAGDSFTLARHNMYASEYDASIESIFEVYANLLALQNNPFEEVTFDEVSMEGSIQEDLLTSRVVKLQTASPDHPTYKKRERLVVHPGDPIQVRAWLEPHDGGPLNKVDLTLRVPDNARGTGSIQVRGGRQSYCGFFFGGSCKAKNLDQLISLLSTHEHNNDLVAELYTRVGTGGGSAGGGEETSEPSEPSPGKPGPTRSKVVSKRAAQDEVVVGGKSLRLRVVPESTD
jgi:hypothetical protein